MEATSLSDRKIVLSQIPDPITLRSLLAQCRRETAILRSLLRVSEKVGQSQGKHPRETADA